MLERLLERQRSTPRILAASNGSRAAQHASHQDPLRGVVIDHQDGLCSTRHFAPATLGSRASPVAAIARQKNLKFRFFPTVLATLIQHYVRAIAVNVAVPVSLADIALL